MTCDGGVPALEPAMSDAFFAGTIVFTAALLWALHFTGHL